MNGSFAEAFLLAMNLRFLDGRFGRQLTRTPIVSLLNRFRPLRTAPLALPGRNTSSTPPPTALKPQMPNIRQHASADTFDGRTHELLVIQVKPEAWKARKIVHSTYIDGVGETAIAATENWAAKYK